MIWIFSGLLFTTIVIWWVLLSIILFNSTSVSDLQFFNNLWIDTNAIKEFSEKLVNWIFWFLLLIEIIFLFVFSYKALLTKKEYKKKKAGRVIIAIFFLILSTATLVIWMFLYNQINSLKWLNYWQIEFFDNSKYLSSIFDENSSKININENIIGPITIRFNNEEFMKKLADDGFTAKKTTWVIWEEKIEKPVWDYILIHTFYKKWLTPVKLIIEWLNIKSEEDKKEYKIWNINLNNIIEITEIQLDNWGVRFIFDASDLSYLWNIKWYYIPSLKGKTDNEANQIISQALRKEKSTSFKFHSKNIFQWEEYYWLKIITGWEEQEMLDKIFIVGVWNKSNISWEIKAIKDINNKNRYSFIFENPKTNMWDAFIKEYIWKIQDFDSKWSDKKTTLNKKANLIDLEWSSRINHEFKRYWKHKIQLTIIDSENIEHIIDPLTIDIEKSIKIKNNLLFSIENIELDSKKYIKYEENNNIYYLDSIPAPSILRIDARKIRSINPKYRIKNISWDLDNDWVFEKKGNIVDFSINNEWESNLKVKYTFTNRNNKDEIIKIIEYIYISSIYKEAILELKIIKPSSYVPVIVQFDASGSRVIWKDIAKFIFDYWDWTPPDIRDARNTWHRYIKPWIYEIKLTAVTTTWEKFSITRTLVLKDKGQKAKIKLSLKRAETFQKIDFSAEESIWEVATYFWDFGDWNTSTQISPNHFYKKPWIYTVRLTLEYTNRNIKTDEIGIEIY